MTTPVQSFITALTQSDTNAKQAIIVTKSKKLLIQHTHLNTLSEPKIAKNTMAQTVLIAYLIPFFDLELLSWENEITEVKLSITKYTAHFLVTINNNKTVSLFDTGTTISCMTKACFDKLDPKPTLTQTHKYIVNVVNSNSLGPLGSTTCALEFPKKFSS